MEKLFLVDGSGYMYRAFYGIKDLSAPDGFPTSAIYGMATMLNSLNKKYNPQRMAVVFDAKGGETFRHRLWEGYKANRKSMPEDLVKQVPYIKKLIKMFGITGVELKGVEADDIIATIATDYASKGGEVVIVAGDKDLLQLVGPGVCQIDTMKKKCYEPKDVEEFLGVMPERVGDLLALWGDTSDNIPGVPSVGKTTAAKLLNEYGSFDAVLNAAKEGKIVSKKGVVTATAQAIVDFEAQARLSKQLVTLDCQVPLPLHYEDFVIRPQDQAGLRSMYWKFRFKSLLEGKSAPVTAEQKPAPQEIVPEKKAVNQSYVQQSMFEYEDEVR